MTPVPPAPEARWIGRRPRRGLGWELEQARAGQAQAGQAQAGQAQAGNGVGLGDAPQHQGRRVPGQSAPRPRRDAGDDRLLSGAPRCTPTVQAGCAGCGSAVPGRGRAGRRRCSCVPAAAPLLYPCGWLARASPTLDRPRQASISDPLPLLADSQEVGGGSPRWCPRDRPGRSWSRFVRPSAITRHAAVVDSPVVDSPGQVDSRAWIRPWLISPVADSACACVRVRSGARCARRRSPAGDTGNIRRPRGRRRCYCAPRLLPAVYPAQRRTRFATARVPDRYLTDPEYRDGTGRGGTSWRSSLALPAHAPLAGRRRSPPALPKVGNGVTKSQDLDLHAGTARSGLSAARLAPDVDVEAALIIRMAGRRR